jgi:hypothetical protein
MPEINSTLACAAAAAGMAHELDDVADQHVALWRVGLGEHAVLPAAVAGDLQEPGRERAERLIERLSGRGERGVAVAAPVACGRRHEGLCLTASRI